MIRDIVENDYDTVYELGELLHSNFRKMYKFDEVLKNDYFHVLVYELDSKVLGFIIYTHLYETTDILDIVVDDDYRRQGIASDLINHVIENSNDEDEFYLEVASKNEAAIKLYKKFGFEKINTRPNYYPDGDDALIMMRRRVNEKVIYTRD